MVQELGFIPGILGLATVGAFGCMGGAGVPPPRPELVGQRFASDCEGLADGDGEEQALKISP